MTYSIDLEIKNACYFVTEKEQAITRRYEREREQLISLRRNIAAGLVSPKEVHNCLRAIR